MKCLITVWMSMMVCLFGSYTACAAPAKIIPGAVGWLIHHALKNKWPLWVVVIVAVLAVVVIVEDRKK